MENNYTKWYAVCPSCEWVAPLGDISSYPTEREVRSNGYCARTDICNVCDSEIIIVLYRIYPSGIDIHNTPHGWYTEISPTSSFHREILDRIQSENDIGYWLRKPNVA